MGEPSVPSNRGLKWAVASLAVIVLGLGVAIGFKYASIVNRPLGPPRRVSVPVEPVVVDAGPRAELAAVAPEDAGEAAPEPMAVVDAGADDAPLAQASPDAGSPVAVVRAEDPRPTRPAVKGRGKLTLKTKPRASVYLNGRRIGDTPLINLSVPAGVLTLRLVRSDTRAEQLLEVEVQPNRTTVRRHNF